MGGGRRAVHAGGEGLAAVEGALEGFGLVEQLVPVEGSLLGEGLLADGTHVGLLASVDPDVARQVGLGVELLVASLGACGRGRAIPRRCTPEGPSCVGGCGERFWQWALGRATDRRVDAGFGRSWRWAGQEIRCPAGGHRARGRARGLDCT